MKEKAASKSTNWNLRVIASRLSANFQSGSRLIAVFNSSIVNFAIDYLQGIFLLNPVDAAIAGQLAGIKRKRADGKSGAGIERVMGEPFQHLARLGMPQPRQGDMGHEFVLVLRLADTA